MPSHVFLNPEAGEGPYIGAAMRQGSDASRILEGQFMAAQKGHGGLHPKRAAEFLERLDTIAESDVDDEYWESFDTYRERLREKVETRNVDYR